MADQRDGGIAWCDESWNPIRGCQVVGPECAHCYAMGVAARFSGPGLPYEGLAKRSGKRGLPQWTGEVRLVRDHLLDPLRWRRARRIFTNSMSDLFYEGFTDAQIDNVVAVQMIASTHERSAGHTFQNLTKRPERMHAYLTDPATQERVARAAGALMEDGDGWADALSFRPEGLVHPRIWWGVSVGMRDTRDRIAELRDMPAGLRFVSFEPLLEDLGRVDLTGIHWAIIGGESGASARPLEVAWVRRLMKHARAAGTAIFVKQLGSNVRDSNDAFDTMGDGDDTALWPPTIDPEQVEDSVHGFREDHQGALVRIRLRKKGGIVSDWPPDLRVQEFPR